MGEHTSSISPLTLPAYIGLLTSHFSLSIHHSQGRSCLWFWHSIKLTFLILMVVNWPILHPDSLALLWAWTEPYCCLFPVVVIGHICCTHILTTCHPCPTSQPHCQFQVCRLDCNLHSSVCKWHSDPLYRLKQLLYLHFASHHNSSVVWRHIMWGLEHGCQHFE